MSNTNLELSNDELKELEENLKASLSLNSIANNSEDDFEDDFEDITESLEAKELMSKLNKNSKNKKTNTSNSSKATMYKQETVKRDTGELPSWHLGRLERSADLEVFVPYHEIPYKEQRWPVRERNMIYKVELVTKQKENIDCFSALHDGVENYKEKLRNGLIRYYKVITYESIPSNQRELGMIEIYENGKCKIHLRNKLLADMRIDNRKLEENIKQVLKKLIRIDKSKTQTK